MKKYYLSKYIFQNLKNPECKENLMIYSESVKFSPFQNEF